MYGKKVINIWLAFRILGLEMNFDNIISVTCILCWNSGNFTIQQKQPTRCNLVTEFIIPPFVKCSTCFERYAAHNQEL